MTGKLIVVVFLGSVVAALAGCSSPERAPVSPNIALINTIPADYTGRMVRLSGPIQYVQAPGVFILGQGGEGVMRAAGEPGLTEQILVISDVPTLGEQSLTVGDWVQVTGIVRTFDTGLRARTAPSFAGQGRPVDEVFYSRWTGKPTIEAQRVERLRYPEP